MQVGEQGVGEQQIASEEIVSKLHNRHWVPFEALGESCHSFSGLGLCGTEGVRSVCCSYVDVSLG